MGTLKRRKSYSKSKKLIINLWSRGIDGHWVNGVPEVHPADKVGDKVENINVDWLGEDKVKEMQQMVKLMENFWPRLIWQKVDWKSCSRKKPEGWVWQAGHSAGVDVQLNVDNVLAEGGQFE